MDTINEEFNYYLTDTIFLNEKKMYYEDEDENRKEIKKYNWHKILCDYGWEKLPKKWITKLNKYATQYEKNSQ